MRVIKLDATQWKSEEDFYNAMCSALEAPSWHGKNADALLDSMSGGVNGVEPPYKIWIIGTRDLSVDVRTRIGWMVTCVTERYQERGREPVIFFQIDP